MAETAFVSRIQIYPIKSLDATVLQEATMLPSGALEFDRTWALFDTNGKFVNGKRYASIHRLRSNVDLKRRMLSICEGGELLPDAATFSLDEDRGEIESWLRPYFGFPVELKTNGDVGFPDDTNSPGPTIISVATLQEIARWFDLPAGQLRARFRTNIEIDGVPAFWEDRLFGAPSTVVKFAIGNAVLDGINPCQRCIVPTRDPISGREDKEFARRFAELRRETVPAWADKSRFNHFYRAAINTRRSSHGDNLIRIGDRIRVL